MDDQRAREFCKDISGGAFFSAYSLKKATTTTLLEKFCLWFIKRQFVRDEPFGSVMVFKTFRNKIYIIDHFYVPPEGYRCRHELIYTARGHSKRNLIENNPFLK